MVVQDDVVVAPTGLRVQLAGEKLPVLPAGPDRLKLTVVEGPTVSWVQPDAGRCVAMNARLMVAASSSKKLRSAKFYDGTRRIAATKSGRDGLFGATWKRRGAAKGTHRLRVVVADSSGQTATASQTVKVCR